MSSTEEPSRDEQIGLNVRRARGAMSQQELADAMREKGFRWSQATVYEVEAGKRPLRLSEAAELAQITDRPLDELTLFELSSHVLNLKVELLSKQTALDHAFIAWSGTVWELSKAIYDLEEQRGKQALDEVLTEDERSTRDSRGTLDELVAHFRRMHQSIGEMKADG